MYDALYFRREWNGLHSVRVGWDRVDELLEAEGISSQLLVWIRVPGLCCSVMAFLSRWLWCWIFIFTVVHATLVGLILSASHSRPGFLQIPRLVKITKLVPPFWMRCLELRVFPGRAVVSRKFSSWWFELKFIHLDEMLSKMSPLTWAERALRQVYRDENTNEFMPGKLDKEIIFSVSIFASNLQLIRDFLCIF